MGGYRRGAYGMGQVNAKGYHFGLSVRLDRLVTQFNEWFYRSCMNWGGMAAQRSAVRLIPVARVAALLQAAAGPSRGISLQQAAACTPATWDGLQHGNSR